MIETRPIAITCAGCSVCRTVKSTPKGEARTPTGWKKLGDATYCPLCWRKKYVLRAITMPVSSPLDCSWDDLWQALRLMWRETTDASNWIMTQCYARDVRPVERTDGNTIRHWQRPNEGEKGALAPFPSVYLYPEMRRLFPHLPSQTCASIQQVVRAKYMALRRDVNWRSDKSLPTHRYPVPFPVPSQGWKPTIEADQAIVSMRIGDARYRLRLKRGPQFRRQMEAFRRLANGEAVAGELAIYDREGVMVKMAAWLPRGSPTPGGSRPVVADRPDQLITGTLAVRTGKDSLLIARNPKDEVLWRYNGDHLRRWAAEHRNQLQRWSEDQKYEQRPVPPFAERRQAAVTKFRNRMNSATHEIAAQLAGYASRRHFARVRYDDNDRSYMGDGFPWYRLRTLIAEKLDARGITFEATGELSEEKPQ
jgi:hypothetical protein